MNDRNVQMNKLIEVCLDELNKIYDREQSIRILLVLASIYYLNLLKHGSSQQEFWARPLRGNGFVQWLDDEMKRLEYEDRKFDGVFTGLVSSFVHFSNHATNHALENAAKKIHHFHYNQQDEIVTLINAIAMKFGGDMAIHGTPASITNLSLGLVRLEQIQSFADYCSGISSVYLEMFYRLKVIGKEGFSSYYGEELHVSSYLISRLLMLINQVPHFNIVNKDVLDPVSNGDPNHTFDFIFSDAPFGAAWNQDQAGNDPRYEHGVPPKSSADWAFYQNALYHLHERGKAIVVGTKGTLVRSSEEQIRKSILEEDLIEAIVTLPENLYFKIGIGTELIIFNKRKPASRKNKILFIDAGKFSCRINRNQHTITEEGLSKIIDSYWHDVEETGFSRIVDLEEVRSNNFSLNSKRYLDLDLLKKSFRETVKLGEIAKISRGVQLSKEEYEELSIGATHYFLNIKDIENGRIHFDETTRITYKKTDWIDKFSIRPMDILITSKGSTIKFAVVDHPFQEAFIGGNLSIIRVNPQKYNVYVLYEFLQSDIGRRMIDALQTGTTIKLINPSKLEQLEVPSFSIEFMNEVGDQLQRNKLEYEETIKEVATRFAAKKNELLEQLGIDIRE